MWADDACGGPPWHLGESGVCSGLLGFFASRVCSLRGHTVDRRQPFFCCCLSGLCAALGFHMFCHLGTSCLLLRAHQLP